MPIVRRKRALDTKENVLDTRNAKRLKTGKKELCEYAKIGYVQDHYHSIYRSLPNSFEELRSTLTKEIGSFLNGKGGILCFGCRANGTVYGDPLDRKAEDNLKLIIDDIFKKFRPMVEPQNYRVTFTPVSGWYSAGYKKKVIVELRIQAGDPHEMYEDFNHEAYLRKGDAPYGPLTPHDIKRLTTQQLRQKLKAIRPIQKVLQTPTKELSSPVFEAQKVVQIAKTKFRVKVPRRLPESSGSDEDPVSVAVVKPIVSSESKSSSNNQQRASEGEKDRKKSSTVATSKNNVAEKGTLSSKVATASTKTAVASSVPHPLAQTVKAASKPALNQNRTTTKTEVAKPALATSQTSSAATKTTSTVCSSSTGVTSSSAAQSTPALSSSTRQATVTKTTTAEPVRRSSCGSSSSVPTNRKPAPPVSSSTSNHASSKTTTAEPTRRSSCDSSSSVPTNRKPAQPVSSSTSNHASSKTTTAEPTRRLSCGSSSSVPTNRKPAQPVSSSTSNHASSKPVSTNSSTAASKVVPTKPIQVDPRHQAMSTTAKGGLSTTSKTYHKLPVPRVTAHAATGNEVAPFVSRACRNQSNEYRKDHLSQLPQQQGSHHHYLPPPPRPPQPLVPPPSHYSHYQYPYHPLQSQGMWMNGTWYMYGNCALNW